MPERARERELMDQIAQLAAELDALPLEASHRARRLELNATKSWAETELARLRERRDKEAARMRLRTRLAELGEHPAHRSERSRLQRELDAVERELSDV